MITKGMATLQVYAGKRSNKNVSVFEDDLSGCLFLYCTVCGATYKEEAGTKCNLDKWDEFCEEHKHEEKEVKDMLGPYGFGFGLANNTLTTTDGINYDIPLNNAKMPEPLTIEQLQKFLKLMNYQNLGYTKEQPKNITKTTVTITEIEVMPLQVGKRKFKNIS